jgi:hypothetical protein
MPWTTAVLTAVVFSLSGVVAAGSEELEQAASTKHRAMAVFLIMGTPLWLEA